MRRLSTLRHLCILSFPQQPLRSQDMAEFADQYSKDKAGQGKLLKVKFSVSLQSHRCFSKGYDHCPLSVVIFVMWTLLCTLVIMRVWICCEI
jgi:hypothetical protein